MTRKRIIGLCALVVGVAGLVWLTVQDIRAFYGLVQIVGNRYSHSIYFNRHQGAWAAHL